MNFSCRILFAWTLAFAYLILVLLGPVDTSLIEFKIHMGALPAFWRNLFPWLQTAILLISLIIMRFPLSLRLLSLHLILGLLFLFLGKATDQIWSYNTHMLFLEALLILSYFIQNPKQGERNFVSAASFLIGFIYLQAAFSKMLVSGIFWMNSGTAIFVHLFDFNPMLSKLAGGHKILFAALGWGTVLGEIVTGLLFFSKRTRMAGVLLSLIFHIGVWFSFHISFWHLWIFFPALYIPDAISWWRARYLNLTFRS